MTNYAPNKSRWWKGDVVIHDADAKEPKMLMVVIGYSRDGLCKTQYCNPLCHRRTIWQNGIEFLHDPKKFGIDPAIGEHSPESQSKAQAEFERVRRWNQRHEIGIGVITTSADGGFETETTCAAYFRNSSAYIGLKRGGTWLLRFVEPIKECANA